MASHDHCDSKADTRSPDVLVEFHKTFKGMNTNSQRYHMSSILQKVRSNHLVDYINHLSFKLSCAAIVKQWASLETDLKVQQSRKGDTYILNSSHC